MLRTLRTAVPSLRLWQSAACADGLFQRGAYSTGAALLAHFASGSAHHAALAPGRVCARRGDQPGNRPGVRQGARGRTLCCFWCAGLCPPGAERADACTGRISLLHLVKPVALLTPADAHQTGQCRADGGKAVVDYTAKWCAPCAPPRPRLGASLARRSTR